MTTKPFSHALIVSAQEADELLSGRSNTVRRPCSTQLRMQVGLLRDDGLLLASAPVIDASEVDSKAGGSEWKLGTIDEFPKQILLPAGGGPLWKRLSITQRKEISDRALGDVRDARATSESADIAAHVPKTPSPPLVEEVGATHNLEKEDVASGTVATEARSTTDDEAPAQVEDNREAPTLAPTSDHAAEARKRAFAYVPDHAIDIDQAYRVLVSLRDNEVKQAFPEVLPERGILRRTMIQALLETGVGSKADYDELVPADLKRLTDRRHVEVYLDPIVAILARVD
jgi:hypothetical protein